LAAPQLKPHNWSNICTDQAENQFASAIAAQPNAVSQPSMAMEIALK
jgi:hypothetical protein